MNRWMTKRSDDLDGLDIEELVSASRNDPTPASAYSYTYSPDKIDTSIGNNGYSWDVPAFAFYKGEPDALRRQRFDKLFAEQRDAQQREIDAALKSRRDEHFWRDTFRGIGHTTSDALMSVPHTWVSAAKAVKNGVVNLAELAARAPGGFGLWQAYDKAVMNGIIDANEWIDRNAFDPAENWIGDRFFNRDARKGVEFAEDWITDPMAQVWALSKVPGLKGPGASASPASGGTSALSKTKALLDATEGGAMAKTKALLGAGVKATGNGIGNYFRLVRSPEAFNYAADDIRDREFGSATKNLIHGIALAGIPGSEKVLSGTQAALASKSPALARLMGVGLAPVRHPWAASMAISPFTGWIGRAKPYSAQQNAQGKTEPASAANNDAAYNKNVLKALAALGILGAGGYGMYKLLSRKKKKKDDGKPEDKKD